jgi:hypothetical protein
MKLYKLEPSQVVQRPLRESFEFFVDRGGVPGIRHALHARARPHPHQARKSEGRTESR